MAETFGQYLVNDLLPKDLQTQGTVDKKDLYNRIYTMVRRDPKDAAERIDKLRILGHELATTEGISVGLEDIAPDPRKNIIVKPIMAQVKKTKDPDKRRALIAGAEKKLLQVSKQHPGSMGEMVRSGGRGKDVQLMRTSNAVLFAKDPVTRKVYPWMIPRGFAEGLKPSEDWVASTESRVNLMDANLAVTEPGALSKLFVNNMNDQLVLAEDCGTQNGVMLNTDDPNLVDRYLARPEASFPRNTLVTPHVATQLRKKAKSVMVRSPITCELNDGVCQKCYGLNENGQPQGLGTNIGVRSAQALAEPITQFVISAKHGVRGKTSDKKAVEGMVALHQMLEIPKSFVNKATLSTSEGKVTGVERAPQGGFNVNVGETKHYVPSGLSPVVRVGQRVTPGDALSDGIPKPDEVVQYKGLGAGRKYMVDQLHDIYRGRGLDIDKRHFEVLARSHLNHVRIDEDPEERFYPGEIVNYTTMMKTLGEDVKDKPVNDAIGSVLAQGYMHHTAGTPVTPEIAGELAKNRIRVVSVSKRPPKISFFMTSLSQNPLLNPDWMARLGHRYLKESLLEGAHFGQFSNIHGTHPVPAYVYGREFGQGSGGRY